MLIVHIIQDYKHLLTNIYYMFSEFKTILAPQ